MENIEIINTGALIGYLAGLLIIFKSMYDNTFNWWRSLLIVPTATIVGYALYELLSLTSVPVVTILVITIYVSLNSFLFIEILTDKDITEQVFDKYIKKPILGDKDKKSNIKDKKDDKDE